MGEARIQSRKMSVPVPLRLLLLLLLWIGQAGCDGDGDVLLALKQGLGDGSGSMRNWIAGTGFCNWTGIQCQNDRVLSISLPNSNIQGTLTPLLGRLEYLTVLNFDLNNLTGSIPITLENCSRLANISLGSNQLTGIIPRNLDRCSGLQRLDVWNNQLQGTIPPSLGNCSLMNYLSLGQNNLSGTIPPELGKLGNLQILRLFTNNLVGDFPKFLTNCTGLEIISIRNNSLTGFLPPELERLVRLTQLRIQSNFFQGTLPPQIGNMTSLYYMDISSNMLSGSIPATFGNLHNLQQVFLNNNSLSGRVPSALANCRRLGTLDLSHNLLQGPLPDNIGDFEGLTNLTLDNNFITGSIPDGLGRLKLINLDMSSNMLEGSLPAALSGLQSSLNIALNLAHNSLSGSIPGWIGSFRALQNLSLQGNRFSGGIPPSLTQCVGLDTLNLAGNQLNGKIPDDIGNLKLLSTLDLSSNSLSGEVPSSLASLQALMFLNLSNNQLEGPVPDSKRFKLASFTGNSGLCGPLLNKTCHKVAEKRDGSGSKNRTILIAASIVACTVVIVCSFLTCWYIWYRRQKGKAEKAVSGNEADSFTGPLLAGPLVSFSPQELTEMTDNFSRDNMLGAGAFSTVYRGKASKNEYIAVKLLKLDMNEEVRKSFFAEVETLGQVRHRNLVKLIGYCWTWNTKAVVLEYMPKGSLLEHLKRGSLDWCARFKVALGVAQGLAYLHHEFDSPIIHCDVKPGNVLLDSEFEAHVADFGISKIALLDECITISVFRGSIGYAPPEYATSTTVSTKGDVYSYGVVLLEMLTGKPPTSESLKDSSSLQDWVKQTLPLSFVEVIDPKLREDLQSYEVLMRKTMKVALQCTSHVPGLRPSMQQVLNSLKDVHGGSFMKSFPLVEDLVYSPSPYGTHPAGPEA